MRRLPLLLAALLAAAALTALPARAQTLEAAITQTDSAASPAPSLPTDAAVYINPNENFDVSQLPSAVLVDGAPAEPQPDDQQPSQLEETDSAEPASFFDRLRDALSAIAARIKEREGDNEEAQPAEVPFPAEEQAPAETSLPQVDLPDVIGEDVESREIAPRSDVIAEEEVSVALPVDVDVSAAVAVSAASTEDPEDEAAASAVEPAAPSEAPASEPAAPPEPAPFTLSADSACASCCAGGSCSYTETEGPPMAQHTVIKFVQCCGVLANQPKCCPVNRRMTGPMMQCATDENGYICRDARSRLIILTESSRLSLGGLLAIIIIASLIAVCYCGLGARRTHARYYGQPYYAKGYGTGYGDGYGRGYGYGQPVYYAGGGGGGSAAGGICAACLAGYCCAEVCF